MLKFLFGILAGIYLAVVHLLLGLLFLYSMTTTDAGTEALDALLNPKKEKK